MKRRMAAITLALGLVFSSNGSALAASADINPYSQTHPHNQASHWTLTWGTTSPYHVEFYYGDGAVTVWQNTTVKTYYATRGFSPCPGDPTTYYQWLKVWDGWNNSTGTFRGYADDTGWSREAQGSPC
jgi:hypothetical protein